MSIVRGFRTPPATGRRPAGGCPRRWPPPGASWLACSVDETPRRPLHLPQRHLRVPRHSGKAGRHARTRGGGRAARRPAAERRAVRRPLRRLQGQLPRRSAAGRPLRRARRRVGAGIRGGAAAGLGSAGRGAGRRRSCRLPGPNDNCHPALSLSPSRSGNRVADRLLGHRRRPAGRAGGSRRADPRGPADLPAGRPAACGGSWSLVRADGSCPGAAGRNPGVARASGGRRRHLRGRAARFDRLRLGEPRGDAGHHPPPRPGAGRGRDLALRRAVRQRPHRRSGRGGRPGAVGAGTQRPARRVLWPTGCRRFA